jgi:hypothetical protein
MGPSTQSNLALGVAVVGGILIYKKNQIGWLLLIGGIVGWWYLTQGMTSNTGSGT